MKLFCIRCKSEISPEKGLCTSCNTGFLWNGSFLDYKPQNDFYWGELSLKETRALNNKAREEGYRLAVFKHFRNHNRQDLFQYILDGKSRTAFVNFFYKKSRSERCLDLGSGFGAIPSALTKYFKEVYSLELIRERVEFQITRKEQDKLENWMILKGPVNRLPFPDNYFDFVSANGMLEWAAIADWSDTPQNVQIAFLKEIRRVLKPDGVCYIGIENRIGRQYFRGALDHSALPYTSLLPRFIANLICRFKQKGSQFYFDTARNGKGNKYYRTYTYTKGGYKRLLNKAGIENVRLFHTSFSYNLPYPGLDDKWVSAVPNGKTVIQTKLTQFKYAKTALVAKAFSYLTPNFLIFASKDRTPIISDLEEKIEREFGDTGPFFVYQGFNNLMTYSLSKERFYKTDSVGSPNIRPEKKVSGEIPSELGPELFEKALTVLRNNYHKNIGPDKERLQIFCEWIIKTAERYNLNPAAIKKYTDDLVNKYQETSLFAKNHGDPWQGNILIENGKIRFIDEENDPFGLFPIELLRFLLSILKNEAFLNDGRLKPYREKILAIYGDSVTDIILDDFYLAALFYELNRRDLFGPSPRADIYSFYDKIEQTIKSLPIKK